MLKALPAVDKGFERVEKTLPSERMSGKLFYSRDNMPSTYSRPLRRPTIEHKMNEEQGGTSYGLILGVHSHDEGHVGNLSFTSNTHGGCVFFYFVFFSSSDLLKQFYNTLYNMYIIPLCSFTLLGYDVFPVAFDLFRDFFFSSSCFTCK